MNKITLATLEEATAQEVFDQVAEHLLKQGKKSMVGDGCAYRGPEGARCAAGCLISDEEFKIKFEGEQWEYLALKNAVPKKHARLIQNLQKIHDSAAVDKWKESLERVAYNYNLNTEILNKSYEK